MRYERFLSHLETCGGCVGTRSTDACRFALPCAVAESLAKKGRVNNSEELCNYGLGNIKPVYLPEECGGPIDGYDSDVGPCENE